MNRLHSCDFSVFPKYVWWKLLTYVHMKTRVLARRYNWVNAV